MGAEGLGDKRYEERQEDTRSNGRPGEDLGGNLKEFSWEKLARYFREKPEVKTRLGKRFFVKYVTDYGIFCLVPEEIIFISREDLEKGYRLISQGVKISSPKDYLMHVSKNYPSYAYSVLKAFLFPSVDRRRWPRAPLSLKIQYIDSGKVEETHTLDISAGGVRIKLPKALSYEHEYPLVIYLDDGGEPVRAIARVVWSRQVDDGIMMGMEFLHIEDFDRLRISEAVRRKLEESE